MNLFELAAKISMDTRDYEKAVKNATKVSKSLKDIMERSATQSETNKNKIKVLASEYSSAKAKVATLTTAFNKAAKEEGITAERTKQLAKELQEAEKESNDLKGQLDELTKKSKHAGDGFSKLGSALGKGLKTAGKIGVAAVGAAAAGITALTTAAVNNYAEYEQLVGGVETLFGNSKDTVMKYAENAYKTAGLSANEYMATVTSFSASLLKSVGGDTEKAADYANRALTDMSDNANKMGTSMELIQNAYNGFAKANYTMLDNLKLGYGGTGEEMKRLIADAAALTDVQKELGITVDATDMSFGNIVNAISVVQKNMKITGTTADEAGRTIAGSVQSMKSAWTNLVTGLSDENADIGKLVDNLVTTIVGDGTEANLGVLGNVMPAVKTALSGASRLVSELLPEIVQEIPSIIDENLPILAEAAISIIQSLVDGISQNQEMLMTTAFETITYLANSLITMLPQIVQLGLNLIVSLANGIATSLPQLIPTIIDVMLQIVDILTDPENLSMLLDTALVLLTELAWGITQALPELVDATLTIIEKLVEFLLDPENIEKIVSAALEIILALGMGIVNSIPRLLESAGTLIDDLWDFFTETDWKELGGGIIDSLLEGIQDIWEDVTKWFDEAWSGLFGGVGDFFSGFFDGGSGGGLFVNGSHKGGLDYVPYDGYIAELHKGERVLTASEARGYGGTSIGNITINIDGAKYSDEQSLASAVAQEIQNMSDRRAAVYA